MRSRRTPAALLAAGVVGAVTLVAPPVASADSTITFVGHGYGHGRGMGQWGALGYAVTYGWSDEQILGHFYGGTTTSSTGNPSISVELQAWQGRGLLATAPGITVNGVTAAASYVWISKTGPNAFSYATATSCGGPWSAPTPLAAGPAIVAAPGNALEVCETGQVRGYLGDLAVVDRGADTATVNRLPIETYLRGVLPRESPASWADLGSGRGAAALRAQAVAARSYVLSGQYATYANTCDSTTCQVYGGAWTRPQNSSVLTPLTDARTDAAVAATAGRVRSFPDGRVARTEFSASTGGWTAGGTFPAVQDLGDAYPANANQAWNASFTLADLSGRLGVGTVLGLTVASRNGLGSEGGRVLSVRVTTATGTASLTGNEVRQRLGLKSDWFTPNTQPFNQSLALTKALFHDLLGREAGPDAPALASQAAVNGRLQTANFIASSYERAGNLVTEVYQGALHRGAGPAEQAAWAPLFQRTGSQTELRAGIYGSTEALLVAGGDPRAWVNNLYTGVLGRPATPADMDYWSRTAAVYGYPFVVRAVSGSTESADRQLAGYYATMLGRAPDQSGVATFLWQFASAGDITVPALVAASDEYQSRANSRYPF
jgi:SpoIID/LytB domain protein